MGDRIVALVPMRHQSERVPGKNYRDFAGRPLYHHIISSLLECASVSTVVVDTDSALIMEDCAKHFPLVRLIERPDHLRDGKVPMNEVLLHDVEMAEGEFYLQTHSTNPLLRADTISRAIVTLQAHYPSFDSLFGVTRIQSRLWDQLFRPINHNPSVLLRTQDLPPTFEENSCIYIFRRETLERRRNRIGERPLLFEVERLEAWDIDEEVDFRIAEFLYREREQRVPYRR